VTNTEERAAPAAAAPKRPPKNRAKADRDPLSWTRARRPRFASRDEVGILTGDSLATIGKKIAAGDYKVAREGRRLRVLVDSVFDDQDRILAESPNQPKPKGGPGRPKKPKEEAVKSKGRGKKAAQA
jgi:hypothetical protein